MAQILSSEDVYRQLVEESEEDWIYGLVAFAIIEEQCIEWMQHLKKHHGDQAPSAEDIQNWYEQQPERILFRAKGDAEHALAAYSAEAVDQAIEDQREEIFQTTVISEIRLTRRFWPLFGVNVAAGFASAVLFAAVLIVVALFVIADITPVDLLKAGFDDQTERSGNGKAQKK